MKHLRKLTYANVVATLALCLAVSGGVAFAANKIQSGDIATNAVRARNIAPGAVQTNKILKRAIVSGKLALGAVRSNQIADGAVGSAQIANGAINSTKLANGAVQSDRIANGAVGSVKIANGAVGSAQIGAGAVAPSNLQFPVYYAASPTGGRIAVPTEANEPTAYPLSGASWAQGPGQIQVIFGGAEASLAYDGSGSGSCQVYFGISLNGQEVGGGQVETRSTTLAAVEANLGAQPGIDPVQQRTNQVDVKVASNGDCTPQSAIESGRFRVLDFG